MSVRRTIKKTVYAFIYVLLLGGFCTLVILPFLPEKPQYVAPVVTQTFSPIKIENIVVLPHLTDPGPFGKTIDVVARIKNENVRSGTGKYPVVLLVKDPSGATIGSVEQVAYVLPGGVQYIAFIDVPVPSNKEFGTVEIQIPNNVSLEQLPDSARLPEFTVFLRERSSVAVGTQQIERQTGIVTNNSTFDWEKVEVTGVALDEKGNIVGIGKTFVGKLLLGEQREFTITWPVPLSPTSRVIAIATTNIYSDENIVHIIGDPSSLR
ncbi:MAG: FxLYD domain-containing protein [Patescibacteria group bacterium]